MTPPARRTTRNTPAFAALAILNVATGCGSEAPGAGAADPPDLALEGVEVVDVRDGTVQAARTVLVRGSRIVGVVDSDAAVPTATRRVNAEGLYAIPGLWDMHVHSAASVDWHFPLFVAHGVTGVRNMHTTVDSALELTHSVKARLESGDLLGPRFVANGGIVTGPPAFWPGSVVVESVEEARAVVDSLAAAGADFIKIWDHLSRDQYFALMDRARQIEMPVVGHLPFTLRPEEAARAGQRTIEHLMGMAVGCSSKADSLRAELRVLDELPFPDNVVRPFALERALYDSRDPDLCAEVTGAYARHGTMVVPNLVIYRNRNDPAAVLSDSTTMALVPEVHRAEWQRRAGQGPGERIRTLLRPLMPLQMENVRVLRDAGVAILAGSDVGNPMLLPGLSLHQELELLVEAGLSELEALQSATLNPARLFAATDTMGTIQEDRAADLVLLAGNPLDDIRHLRDIRGVMLRGRYLDRTALDALLAGVGERARSP